MIIHLTTDFFWTDTSSIERWPEILLKLPINIESKTRVDVARDYLNYKTDEKGRIIRADEVYGLFGLEGNGSKLVISGCNLIEKSDKGYSLSEDAINLVKAYEDDNSWEIKLAEQLLKYSIRVRAIAIGLINGEGIYFEGSFLKNNNKAYILIDDEKYFILNKNSEVRNLNNLMYLFSKQALGPYWSVNLGISDTEDVEIRGLNKKKPSLKQIGSYCKMPLLLFDYLGWFVDKGDGKYQINKDKMKEDIEEDIYKSLMIDDLSNEVDILKALIKEEQDIRGLFPIELVGGKLREKINPESKESSGRWIDRYFMEGTEKGKFKIVDSEQGQPRHGRGLLGDIKKQLIKLEF